MQSVLLLLFSFLLPSSSLKLLQSEQRWDEHISEAEKVQELARLGFKVDPAGPGKKCRNGNHAIGADGEIRSTAFSASCTQEHGAVGARYTYSAAECAPIVAYHNKCSAARTCNYYDAAIACAKVCAFLDPDLSQATGTSKCEAFTLAVSLAKDKFYCMMKQKCYDLHVAAAADTTGGGYQPYYSYERGFVAWAKNDPRVENMNRESFDIMQTGDFLMLSIPRGSKPSLKIDAKIDRAGSRCGATYIQNLTMSGSWIEDFGSPYIAIRAKPAVPKAQAFEVNTEGTWKQSSKQSHSIRGHVLDATVNTFSIQLKEVKIFVSIDSHRISEHGRKGNRFANFLNLNVQGLSHFDSTSIGGLLGTDEHEYAMQLPEGCESSDSKLLSTSDSKFHLLSELAAS